MNPYQVAGQIRHRLQLAAWPGGGDPVFGARSVLVVAGVPAEDQIPPAFPFCLISVGSGATDPDHPDLIEQTFEVIAAVEVAGDPMGEHAITGGSVASLGQSAGRGILEVQEQVLAAIGLLTGEDGITIQVASTAVATPVLLGRGRHLVTGAHTVRAWCTSARHYEAPQRLELDTGAFDWSGTRCSSRFDFLQYRLVEKAGTSPSSNPADGTVIYTGTDPHHFYGVSVPSSYTYTVFADYNARGAATVEGSSSPEVGSYLVVT